MGRRFLLDTATERSFTMCDYSKEAVASRPAERSETIVLTSFRGTSSIGFASPNDLSVAVCLLPGTEIEFDSAPKYYGRFWSRRAPSVMATARRVDENKKDTHHDALEFVDGTIIKLQKFHLYCRGRVVSLPAIGTPALAQAAGAVPSFLVQEPCGFHREGWHQPNREGWLAPET